MCMNEDISCTTICFCLICLIAECSHIPLGNEYYYFLGQECLAGTVKYVGKVNGKPGTWAGVALQEPGLSK